MSALSHERRAHPAVRPGAQRELISSLAPLLEEVVTARNAEKEQQCRRGITAAELARLRSVTLASLEDYATALETLSWPVPRALIQEIQLHKALLGVHPTVAAGRRHQP